jgi:hypothetical protein
MNLSRVIFWDTNYDTIDWEQKAHYVIERVVMYGFIEDWKAIKAFYGLETIKNEMLQARYLDKKTLNFLSFYFNIPKEQFRCFTYQQSIPTHWDY